MPKTQPSVSVNMVSTQFISRVGLVLFFGLAATAIGAAIPGTESRPEEDLTPIIIPTLVVVKVIDLSGESESEDEDDSHQLPTDSEAEADVEDENRPFSRSEEAGSDATEADRE
ncbi:hypothetical protein MJO29_015036 [Puccinia striiformis f. sp. tritici]|nr:hypothetical protein MJO29_015036 [Puccinia striiformis f. sp. tritici]